MILDNALAAVGAGLPSAMMAKELNPDFVKYAESFGAAGYRPDSVEDFKQTFLDTPPNVVKRL